MYGPLMIDVAGSQLTEADRDVLSQPEVGGIILFARNVETPEQVRALCDDIRQVQPNIIIGADQEGGRVARLRDGFTPLPAMGRIGELFDRQPCQALSLAYDCGYLMASEVLAVGIDISFAPVLDINGVSKVIGDRSFHPHTEAIVALSMQFMRGMKAAGMATTGKHFPGHGSIAPDSHVADAIDEREFDQIMAVDLQPFVQCQPWLDALMPAHVIFSQVDDKPAGFSKIWLQDIARKQLGFDGVLFSDDLSMKAAHVAGDAGARVKAALSAGCDMALVCNDREAALLAIETAKQLPKPNQQRLHAMRSEIPQWQGSLEATCAQFDYWAQAKQNVTEAFFGNPSDCDSKDKPLAVQSQAVDPTNYSS
ncbi:beta-N-acetylhexosaminidase [Psychrobacter sp. FDAARGOS_221]|uniref:beta-N-acetylhexosaminidase n=1 Tax=Psychrobacter sp. FDAARGOS_221 TaxID=1975705 RepID=UPI000BB567FF|nr:beta-N-acetylhexosaminidase [Psychrobacter sp. FDAARGOS_221]PNK60435.1 beta-N-acetylhexosaminidase [Psychrobacter sp. FDAARGOS_221]